jgi:repressor LexA
MSGETFQKRLQAAIDDARMSPSRASQLAGFSEDLLRNLFRGKTKTLNMEAVVNLAQVLGVSVEWLATGNASESEHLRRSPNHLKVVNVDRRARVMGRVEAGVWREALEFDTDAQYDVPIVNDVMIDGIPLAGLEVSGTSFNKVYPSGTIVLVASLMDLGRDAFDGEVCVVHRRNRNGLYEATLKQLEVMDDGARYLWPCSTDPRYQEPIALEPNGEDDDIAITAVVVRSIHTSPRRSSPRKNR